MVTSQSRQRTDTDPIDALDDLDTDLAYDRDREQAITEVAGEAIRGQPATQRTARTRRVCRSHGRLRPSGRRRGRVGHGTVGVAMGVVAAIAVVVAVMLI